VPAVPDRDATALRRWATFATALAVMVGVSARFLTTSPLWLDEALSVNIASLPLGEIGEALRHDGHPPLYYWLLHGWMELFGDGDVAVRALSGILSAATLPLAWLAGRRIAGRSGACWAITVVALSPYAVRYATEARMYSLVMFLVAAGYLLLRSVLDGGRGWRLPLLALGTGALLWSHYWSVYLLAVTGALVLLRWWRDAPTRRASGSAALALVVGALLFVPWLPSFLDQAAHTGTPWATPSRPAQILDVTLSDLGGGNFAEAGVYGAALVVLLVLAAFAHRGEGGRVELRSSPEPGLLPELLVLSATLALGWAVGFLSGGAYASRYAAVVVPLLLVGVAIGLTRLQRGWLLWGLGSLVVVLSVVGIVQNVRTARTQSEELAEVIATEAGPHDVVVVCPDQLGPSLARALGQRDADLQVVPYPAAGDPGLVDWRDYEDRNHAAEPKAFASDLLSEADGARIWLVWNGTYRTFEGQCEALVDQLTVARTTTIVATMGGQFEAANLHRFDEG
jgi:uncharacterized membrane protein